MRPQRLLFLCTAALLPLACVNSPQHSSNPAITVDELSMNVQQLASDKFFGRAVGSEGYDLAAEYAAEVMEQSGVTPGNIREDGKRSYYQPVPMLKMSPDAHAELSLVIDSDTLMLNTEQGTLIIAHPGDDKPVTFDGVVYVAAGIHQPELGIDDLAGLDLRGKLVLLKLYTPNLKSGGHLLPDSLDNFYRNPIRGLGLRIRHLREAGAGAILVLADPRLAWRWYALRLIRRTLPIVAADLTEMDEPDAPHPPVLLSTRDALAPLLKRIPATDPKTGYSPAATLEGLSGQLDLETDVKQVHPSNVVGMILGSDPTLAGEYVTLTAHLDHLGGDGLLIYRGANDNASGSTVLLEVAGELAASPPRRSVLVILTAGEEAYFLGSSHFISHAPIPLESIVAEINLDQVGRAEQPYGLAVIGPESWHGYFGAANVEGMLPLSLIPPASMMGYYMRSDQVVFFREGIASFFVTCGQFEGYHSPNDTPDRLDYDLLLQTARFIAKSVRGIANDDSLPN